MRDKLKAEALQNDNWRGLQNEKIFSNIIIDNQLLECLQGVKSVNPHAI